MGFPHGYHITFGTYGNRLHGTDKPHVDRDHNQYGQPFAPTDPSREDAARERMKQESVRLTLEQRIVVEEAIRDLAARYEWTIHSFAPQTDHTHVVITVDREGEPLRDALKATATRALNKKYGKREWWAEGGSARYLWEWGYFQNAIKYVRDQRDF